MRRGTSLDLSFHMTDQGGAIKDDPAAKDALVAALAGRELDEQAASALALFGSRGRSGRGTGGGLRRTDGRWSRTG